MSDSVVSIVVSALTLGALYCLLASGLSLIWSTLRVFNFAHGGLLILSAYLIWSFAVPVGMPLILAVACAIPIMAVAGLLLQLIAVRPLIGRPRGDLLVMVSTLAVAGIIEGAIQLTWGPLSKRLPPLVDGVVKVGDTAIGATEIASLVVALALVGGLIVLMQYTEWGVRIRAVEQNREMARLMGIKPTRVYTHVLCIAAVLACAAAVVYGNISTIAPAKGYEPLLTSFVVLVFGGAASLWGVAAGAFAIGLLESASTFWLGVEWSPIIVFSILVAVMLIRPGGLVGGRA